MVLEVAAPCSRQAPGRFAEFQLFLRRADLHDPPRSQASTTANDAPSRIACPAAGGWRDSGAASVPCRSLAPATICPSARTIAEERSSLPPARRKPASRAAPAPSVAQLGKADGASVPFDLASGPQQAAGGVTVGARAGASPP